MWLLDKPSVRSAMKQLETALTLNDGTVVYALSAVEKRAVAAAYRRYDQQNGRPHVNLQTCGLTDPCCTIIHDAYNQVQKKGRLKSLRASLLANAETCPFCGFAEPTQLDHYLPKVDYKPLAIYARNLIPSCGPCNNAKSQYVGGPAHEFVHAYFDKFPDVDFLVAEVKLKGASLTTEFSIDPAGLSPDLASSLSFQLKRLNLNERYKKQINVFLFSQCNGMLEVYEERGAEGLREYLRKSGRSLENHFGRNDWRTAFMRGLLQCDAFCKGGVKRYFSRKKRSRRAAV